MSETAPTLSGQTGPAKDPSQETATVLFESTDGGEPVPVELNGEQIDEIKPIVTEGASN